MTPIDLTPFCAQRATGRVFSGFMESRFEHPAADPAPDGAPDPPRDPLRMRTFWALVALAFVADLATLPYIDSIRRALPNGHALPEIGWRVALFTAAFDTLIVALPIAWFGLALLPKTGLPGAPQLRALFAREPASLRAVARGFVQGTAIGVAVALTMAGLEAVGPEIKAIVEVDAPSWWRGLLASFGAGVREEIWFRLGVMTIVLRTLVEIGKRNAPTTWMFWTANAIAAVLFGAIHLPQAKMLVEVTPAVVAMVVGGNAVAGLGFGWVYRRSGIEAAMAAHMATDVVLHVVVPAVAPGP